jgi:hypothetical protein
MPILSSTDPNGDRDGMRIVVRRADTSKKRNDNKNKGKRDDENDWKKVGTRKHTTPSNIETMEKGSMESGYANSNRLNIGFIDLRFLCGKGFNLARGLCEFITAGHEYDKELAVITASGDGQDILRAADAPTS